MRTVLALLVFVSGTAFAAAPFPQTFVDTSAAKFTNKNLNYYRAKKLGLQTVAYYQANGKEYVAGSFNGIVRAGWDGYINLNRAELGEVINNVMGAGNIMRQLTVQMFGGQPAYTVIFQPAAGWAPTQATFDVDDNGFNNFMFAMAQQGYSIIDHSGYINAQGVRTHSAIFQKDDAKRMYYGEYDLQQIRSLQYDKQKEQWWVRGVDVYPGKDGANVYSAILHYGGDATDAHFGISAADFKRINEAYVKKGWYLLQVKESGGTFSAVWCPSALP